MTIGQPELLITLGRKEPLIQFHILLPGSQSLETFSLTDEVTLE